MLGCSGWVCRNGVLYVILPFNLGCPLFLCARERRVVRKAVGRCAQCVLLVCGTGGRGLWDVSCGAVLEDSGREAFFPPLFSGFLCKRVRRVYTLCVSVRSGEPSIFAGFTQGAYTRG